MQVLCIQSSSGKASFGCQDKPVDKGEIYTPITTKTYFGHPYHQLEERPNGDCYLTSIFIDLPKEEGQSFKKEETVEIPQKLQPFYSQTK